MTDPKLPDDLRADVAAALPCAHVEPWCAGDEHYRGDSCPAVVRPAVEALLARVEAERLDDGEQLLAAIEVLERDIATFRAERDTLRRELAEAREAIGEVMHEVGVLRMRACTCDGGAGRIHSVHCAVYLGAGVRALTPKGATDGE
jgi:hypothetical protein